MFQNKNKHKKQGIFKKAALTSFVGLALTFGVVFAEENDAIKTVHHVYVDGKHIGEVSDPTIVEKIIDEKIAQGEEEYETINVTVGEEVTFVTEKVFKPSFDDKEIVEKLDDTLSIKAEAIELKVGEEVVGYFNSKKEVQDALYQYKAKYIPKETLQALEINEKDNLVHVSLEHIDGASKETTKELQVNDSIVLDVSFSKKVSLSSEKVSPKDILSIEDGMKLLEKGTLTEKVHKVQEGEVLGKIASTYNLSLDELLQLNPDLSEDSVLQIGQEINVTALKPFVDVVMVKDEKKEEKISFETEVVESDELYKGDQKVRQNGSNGKKEVHYQVEIVNGQEAKRTVLEETVTKEPVNKVIVKGTKVIPSRGTGEFTWPTIGGYISSYQGHRWGRMHKGIDIARPSNRAILAADNGTVVEAGWSGSFGNKIVINHNNGYKTLYAHLSSINVRVGQTVEKGSTIGIMGSTGNSTGVHLHFELYKNGVLQNPLDYY